VVGSGSTGSQSSPLNDSSMSLLSIHWYRGRWSSCGDGADLFLHNTFLFIANEEAAPVLCPRWICASITVKRCAANCWCIGEYACPLDAPCLVLSNGFWIGGWCDAIAAIPFIRDDFFLH
jgi:hypothetical protein